MRKSRMAAAAMLVLILGCSPAARDRARRFFFEVPAEATPATAAAPESANPDSATAAPGQPAETRFVSEHAPYTQGQCDACHDRTRNMRLVEDFAGECAGCHEDYFDKTAVRHPPVAQGDCASCHLPHRGAFPALLKATLIETCTSCHDEPGDLSAPTHAADGVERCTMCHDAHFGGEHQLKPGYPGGPAAPGSAAGSTGTAAAPS